MTRKNEKRKVLCSMYSRVVGYLRPVQFWNIAKQQEFKDRKTFSLGEEDERERSGAS